MNSEKTSPSLNPNSLEWRISFDLGYWRAIYVADLAAYPASYQMHACARHRSEAVASIAREATRNMSRARRRAFGAQIRSTFRQTLQWKGHRNDRLNARFADPACA